MADSKAIRAGRAFVELFADRGPLEKDLALAERKLSSWAKTITAIGAGIVLFSSSQIAAGVAAALKFGEIGESLHHLSQRTGESAKTLSALGFAAEGVGGSLSTVGDALTSVNNFMLDATEGSIEAQRSISRLGLSYNALLAKSPADQFRDIAQALSEQTSEGVRARIGTQILGSAYAQLAPLLRGGAEGLAAAEARARDLGLVMSDEDAAAAKEFSTAIRELRSLLTRLVTTIGGALAPMLTDVVGHMIKVVSAVVGWIKENKGLVIALFLAAAAGVVLGAALIGVGIACKIAAIGVAVLSVALTILQVTFSPTGVLIIGIGLFVAGFLAIGYAAVKMSGALERIGQDLGHLGEDFASAWGGIQAALAKGDLAAAMRVGMAALNVAWVSGLGAMSNEGATWKAGWILMFEDAIDFTARSLENARHFVATLNPFMTQAARNAENRAHADNLRNLSNIHLQQEGLIVDPLVESRRRAAEELRAARAELAETVQAAHLSGNLAGGLAGGALGSLATGRGGAAGVVDSFANARHAVETVGTLSGAQAAALAFGGESPEERTARNTKDTADRLAELLRLMPTDAGIAFGQ
jgi:TP901 family phage tail tape measure protein